MLNIRCTKINEYKEIYNLKKQNHNDNEKEENFISKIDSNYEGCLVADLDGVVGYIISLPYFIGKPYPKNKLFKKEKETNCLLIYDLFVSEDFRRKNIGSELVINLIKNKNYNIFGLFCTIDCDNFWKKFGFREFFKLNYDGSTLQYMALIK